MISDTLAGMDPDALRTLAWQVGLRGAFAYDIERLRIALGAWLASAPWAGSPDVGEGDPAEAAAVTRSLATPGLAVESLPPALQTETMAKLLETQGKQAEAQTLREGLRRRKQPPSGQTDPTASVTSERAAGPGPDPPLTPGSRARPPSQPRAQVSLVVGDHDIRIRFRISSGDDGPGPARDPEERGWQIELWIWRERGSRISRRIALVELEGERVLERPPETALAVAVLGRRRDGALRPIARTELWKARSLTAGSGASVAVEQAPTPVPGSSAPS